jgi:hypothetical protein
MMMWEASLTPMGRNYSRNLIGLGEASHTLTVAQPSFVICAPQE